MTKKLLTAALLGASMLAAAPASATILIGVSFDGGTTITQVATDGNSGTANYNATSNGFVFNVGAQGSPLLAQPTLLSQSINISTGTAGTLSVYVTQNNLTAFNGSLLSSFTSNTMLGVTTRITSFFSQANASFTGTQLQTALFAGPGTFTAPNQINASSPFSETVRYDLTFTGGAGSNFNGTANLTGAVPEPATWGMMLLGFGLIGAAARRSRKVPTVLA